MIDFRFDPFLFAFRPKAITGEVKTVQHFSAFNRVGFFLAETPQRLTTAPMSIICAGDTLSEVSHVATPAANNFRVSYGNVNNFASVGFVEIHASRVGQVAVINYRGLGVNLNSSLRTDARKNLERSLSTPKNATAQSLVVAGTSALSGNVSMASATLAEILFHSARVKNVSSNAGTNDLLTIERALAMHAFGGVEIFTPGAFSGGVYPANSGNWTPPLGTRYVFVAMIGSGGGGAAHFLGDPGAGGGGSGSPALYAIVDLDALGAGPYAWTVPGSLGTQMTNPGANGEHATIFGCQSGHGNGGSYDSGTGTATGGVYTAGSLGAAVVAGRLVTIDHLGNSINGGANTGTTSGAGGNGAAMLDAPPAAQAGAGASRLFAGSGGVAVAANLTGNPGTIYGAGGSGGGGDLGPGGAAGGGAAGGVIFLIY